MPIGYAWNFSFCRMRRAFCTAWRQKTGRMLLACHLGVTARSSWSQYGAYGAHRGAWQCCLPGSDQLPCLSGCNTAMKTYKIFILRLANSAALGRIHASTG